MEASKGKRGKKKAVEAKNTPCLDDLVFGVIPHEKVKFQILRVSDGIQKIKQLLSEDQHRTEISNSVSLLKVVLDPSIPRTKLKDEVVKVYKEQHSRRSSKTLAEEANDIVNDLLMGRLRLDPVIADLAVKAIRHPSRELTEVDGAILQIGGPPLFLFSLLVGKRSIPEGFNKEWLVSIKKCLQGDAALRDIQSDVKEIDSYLQKWLRPYGIIGTEGSVKKLVETGFGKREEFVFLANPKLEEAIKVIENGKYIPKNDDVEAVYNTPYHAFLTLSPSVHWLLVSSILRPPSPLIGVKEFSDTEAFRNALDTRPIVISAAKDRAVEKVGTHSRIALALMAKEGADKDFVESSNADFRIISETASGRLRNTARMLCGQNIISETLRASVLTHVHPSNIPDPVLKKFIFNEDRIYALEEIALKPECIIKIIDPSLCILESSSENQQRSLEVLARYQPFALAFTLWDMTHNEKFSERLRLIAREHLAALPGFISRNS